MKTYIAVYLASAFVALLITPLVIRLAHWLRILNVPGVRDVHSRPIPRIGGMAVFFSTMLPLSLVLLLQNTIGSAFRDILPQITVLLVAAMLVFLVGLIDDIRGLRARIRLLAQVVAATGVCIAGIRIESVTIADWLTLDFGWFSWPLTMLWIVGVTNAVNMTDGLDGLAAGISAVACGVIAIFAIHNGQVIMAVLMLALLGSLSGFLYFNFNPAKIFLGDSGSFFLGFTIAASSVMCSHKSSALVGLALPALALGIPIFDTLFSMLRRFLERRSMFSSDRAHFHHRLLDLGLKHKHVVIAIYGITLFVTGLGLFMMITHNEKSLVIFLCLLMLLVLAFRIVGSVRLRETITQLREKYAVTNRTREEVERFEAAQLHLRRATTFEQWWRAISAAAGMMDCLSLSLPITSRDGTSRTLTWKNGSESDSQHMNANIPVQDRRSGPPLNLKIEIYTDGSLESAGRRIALFTRLVEEHGVAALKDIV